MDSGLYGHQHFKYTDIALKLNCPHWYFIHTTLSSTTQYCVDRSEMVKVVNVIIAMSLQSFLYHPLTLNSTNPGHVEHTSSRNILFFFWETLD